MSLAIINPFVFATTGGGGGGEGPPEALDVTGSSNNFTSPWSVAFPALSTGDLAVAVIGWDDSFDRPTVAPPSGPNGESFVSIAGPVVSAFTEVRLQAWYAIATGAWSAGNLDFKPSGPEGFVATTFRVAAGAFDASTPIGATGTDESADATSGSVALPAFTAGGTDGGGLLVWGAAVDTDPLLTLSAGYTELRKEDVGDVASGVAVRNSLVTNSESLSGGTWGIDRDSWASLAFIIRPPA